METRLRLIAAACALVLVAGVVSAFSVDGRDESVTADGQEGGAETLESSDVATQDSAPDAAADGTSTTESTDTSDTSETTDASATGDGTTTPEDTTAPSGSTATTPTDAPSAPDVPLGVTATTPGTYTYDVTGCCDGSGAEFSGTSQLTVPVPDSSGRQAQLQSGPEGSTTTIYRFTPEGTYLESMSAGAQGYSIELAAPKPFLIIPAGAPVGHTSTGVLRISGMGIDADVTVTVTDVGPQTSTVQIDAVIDGSVATCNVDGAMTSTIRARTSDQLPIETTAHTEIDLTGVCFGMEGSSSDVRTVLRQ